MFGDLERTPRTLLVCERSSFLDEKNRLSSQVEQLHFNYKVINTQDNNTRIKPKE